MSILASVSKGPKARPHFIALYGPGGVGKSTLGASAPSAIFLGTDDGTDHMDVARIPAPKTWADVKAAVSALTFEEHDFKSLVIDTVNGLEPLVHAHICREANVKSIEDVDGGFGKGYVRAEEEWIEFFRSLKRLREKMNVIILGHAKIKPTDDIYQGERYDRYILKMHERAADIVLESVDCMFFANYEQVASKEKGAKKAKMRGEGRRRMFTEQRPAFVAKNRFDLPFEMDLSWEEFIQAAARYVPSAGSTDEMMKLFKGREEIATAYLVKIGWLLPTQTLNDLAASKRKPIFARKDEFLKAVDEYAESLKEPETTEDNE